MPNGQQDRDFLWREFELHVSLYRHYLDLILRFNIFYYAITGAILSFVLTRKGVSFARHALLFPVLMSFVYGLFFGYAAILSRITRDRVFQITGLLGLRVGPELHVLTVLLWISGILFLLIAASLGVLWWTGLGPLAEGSMTTPSTGG